MSIKELNREQMIQVKQNYLTQLDDEGKLNEVLYDRPEWDEDGEHHLSMGELANADNIVTDALMFDHYAGYHFTEGDFE